MKILQKDIKHGIVKVKIDRPEDSWYLSSIIEPDDMISGMTERKIKIGSADEKSKIARKIVFIKIRVEKIDAETVLRVSGPITEAPEDIPKGDYHTFALDDGAVVTIQKSAWSKYSLKKLDEAAHATKTNILIVAFDRESAIFALLRSSGHEVLLELQGDVSKKDQDEKKTNFYKEIAELMAEYDAKNHYSNIVVASPAFWKEYLLKELKDDIKKKSVLATCSSVDGSTISEILKRPELKTVLEKDRSAQESRLLEELLDGIRKDNAVYGLTQVKEKIITGNVSKLLVSEGFIAKAKASGAFQQIDRLMESAESLNAEIIIISSEEAAKKLDGLSGIAALFRWKENYG